MYELLNATVLFAIILVTIIVFVFCFMSFRFLFDRNHGGSGANPTSGTPSPISLTSRVFEVTPLTRKYIEESGCVICLKGFEDAERVCQLMCCHNFHQSCIVEWMAEHRSCPVCLQHPKEAVDLRKDGKKLDRELLRKEAVESV